MAELTIREIAAACRLKVLAGEDALDRTVSVSDINRPGLALAGYCEYFDVQRIQVIGRTELAFFASLPPIEAEMRWHQLCELGFPCLIITRNGLLPEGWAELAASRGLPVLTTKMATTRFIGVLTHYLERKLAPSVTIHGVLVDVYGIGVMITGESGIGKSETALELIQRGHRLVADDAVEITLCGEEMLEGRAPEAIRHLLEVRGLGILDIRTLFGLGAVRVSQQVEMVIRLEEWEAGKCYVRLGIEDETVEVLGVKLPFTIIPVRPGRNLAGIVEVAAMNRRMKAIGEHGGPELAALLGNR